MPTADFPVVSAAVMAHPSRFDAASTVLARLSPLPVRLALDPDPAGPPSTVRSARLAFAAVAPGATHHLVVQDDVYLPDGFVERLRRAIARQPQAAVSLFVEWGSRTATLARWAALIDAHWVPVINPYVPTQALVLPAALAHQLAEDLSSADVGEPDDRAVLRFLRRIGAPALVVVPNLVEHLDLPSLTGNRDQGARRSVCWLPHDSGDLNDRVLDVPRMVPFFAWTTGEAIIIDAVDDLPQTQRPTAEVLGGWGLPESLLADALTSALRRANGEPLLDLVGDWHLHQVWLTAVAMGVVAQRRWPGSTAALAGPVPAVLAEALSTLAPGQLRRHLDPDRLLTVRPQLSALVAEGLRLGGAA